MDVLLNDAYMFQCKMAKCTGNVIIKYPGKIKFIGCPICGVFNCRNCNDIHTGITCRQLLNSNEQSAQQIPVQASTINQNVKPNEQQPVEITVSSVEQLLVANPKQSNVTSVGHVILPQASSTVALQSNVLSGIFKCENEICEGSVNLQSIETLSNKLMVCQCKVLNCSPCQTIREKNDLNAAVPKNIQNDLIPLPTSPTDHCINFDEELHNIDDVNLIVNKRNFECAVCVYDIVPGDGVMIRNCGHECCKNCLIRLIANNDRAVISCITPGCSGKLQDREIRELVTPEMFDRYMKRSIREAQKCLPGLFMCRTNDCGGMWCIDKDNNPTNYRCDICSRLNCHNCRAIHEGMACSYYRAFYANEYDPNVIASLNLIVEEMNNGKVMVCPGCQMIVQRDEGCSWLLCFVCKTEICWATRGPRWGPNGTNDTSGGCKCDYHNGNKCHPECNNCH